MGSSSHGHDGLLAFLDGVYETSKKKGSEILLTCPSEEPFAKVLGDKDTQMHVDRMSAIHDNISHKCILTEDSHKVYCSTYCEYRRLSKNYVDSVPFYVYDNKYAYILFEADPSPKIIEIESPLIFQAFRRQFYSMWDKATPLNALQASSTPPSKKTARR